MKISFISLGCAKNQVNCEQMIWLVREAGYEVTGEVEYSDAVVLNTCGFIESAKSEAIEYIIELGMLKAEDRLGAIIVTGCLPERYREEVLSELPEIDALVGTGSLNEIVEVIEAVTAGESPAVFGDIDAPVSEAGRVITTSEHWTYLRIAEGCDNRCSFCVIPSLRGKYRSRDFNAVITEAKWLADGGMREIIIIAQDITRYGLDRYGELRLPELLTELAKIDGIEWIRLHYLYPDEMTDELIDVVAREDKIVKYLDIPIQHINDRILRAMNRRGTSADIRALFKKLRERIPGVVLRTSLIAGLPGEGEPEFEELCDFLREVKIERAGVFPYSPEEGTPAAAMENQVGEDVKSRRVELIMDIQARIMDEFSSGRVGKPERVFCEGYDELAECWFGRSPADSPEIDGKVFFTAGGAGIREGDFYSVLITDVLDGDLIGELIDDNGQ